MNKYFYFAVIRFEVVGTTRDGRPKLGPVTHFGKCYSTAKKALMANIPFIIGHLGERFTVVGFPKELDLDERGVSRGYKDDNPE